MNEEFNLGKELENVLETENLLISRGRSDNIEEKSKSLSKLIII